MHAADKRHFVEFENPRFLAHLESWYVFHKVVWIRSLAREGNSP